MGGAKTLLQNMPTRGRVVLAATVVGTLVATFLLFSLLSRPSYSTLMSGLDPAETGKITEALDAKGIGYELQNNGTALAVEKGKTADARIALASAGLGAGANHKGFELVTEQKLGASNFQQRVAYQQALQGELAKTIEQIKGVGSAQVTLVLPEEQVFAEEQQPASASVLLTGDSAQLDPAAVRGIAQLVSNSVKGLKPSNVSITDGSGTPLWPNGSTSDAAGPSATAKQAAETRAEQQLQGKLDALLVQTLGPGKAQTQVNADLNVDEVSRSELKHEDADVPLQVEEESERLRGTGGAAGGTTGAAGNIPTLAQGGGAGGNSNYQRTTRKETNAVDKTVTRTKVAPGQIQKLDVALVVDKSVPAATVAGLRRAVASAAGIDAERGDTLAVTQVAFAKAPAPKASSGPVPAAAVGYAKWVALGIGSLLFLFFVTRHLRKRESEALTAGEPVWLREIEAPRALADLEAGTGAAALAARGNGATPELHRSGDTTRRQLEHLVDREPERVAAQVRAWMQDA